MKVGGHVSCGSDSHFKVIRSTKPEIPPSLSASRFTPIAAPHLAFGNFGVVATCARLSSHVYIAHFQYSLRKLIKYGQTPAIAEIEGAEIKKYRSVLAPENFAELNRAIGLTSHGIGIGAFVYLRRIFERLISEHYARRTERAGTIDGFDNMKMVDKVKALADVLPPAIVRAKAAYGILSKGIHELSEDECKLFFPVVKAAIISMLDADLQQKEAERSAKALEVELAAITGKLKGA